MDRIALDHHGIQCVVATLGTALTGDHLRLLWRRARRLYFCFDGDNAGRKAAWRALEQVMDGLEADRHARFLFLPQGEDPDDTVRREGSAAFRQRLEKAVSPSEFLFDHLREGLDMVSPEGRAALVHRVRPYLERISDPLLREFIGRDIGERLGLRTDQILGKEGTPTPLRREPPSPAVAALRPWSRSPVAITESLGRDPERLLLALLLRHPCLLAEHEEELGALALKSPPGAWLLSELILHAHRSGPPSQSLPPELAQTVRTILAAEADGLEGDEAAARHELQGCLLSLQLAEVDRELRRLEEKARLGTLNERDQMEHLGLKRERDRLRLRKRTVIS